MFRLMLFKQSCEWYIAKWKALEADDIAVAKKQRKKSRRIILHENHTAENDKFDNETQINKVATNKFYADRTPYSKNE